MMTDWRKPESSTGEGIGQPVTTFLCSGLQHQGVSLEMLSCFPAILIHFDQETEVEESIEEQYSGSGPK